MKWMTLSVLLLACRLGAQAPPDSVGLEQFQTLAWPVARRIEALRAERDAAAEALGAAHAQRGPVLALEIAGGWISRTQELQMGGRTITFGDGSSADAALQGAWTLSAGGALRAGEEAAACELRARSWDLAADSLRLAGELRAAFWSALAAEAGQEAAGVAVTRLERHLEDLRARRSAGSAGEEALLLVESRLEVARQDQALRRGEREAARLELGALCGAPGQPLVPIGELEPTMSPADEPRRPAELLALDARLEQSRALLRQRVGAQRPRLEALAGLHLGRPGVDPVANEWMSYAATGLRLRWSLWDGGLARRCVAEARLAGTAMARRLDEAERQSAAGLARARELAAAAGEAWEAAARRCAVEERRGGLVEERWRQGMATERDWLDAVDEQRLARQERALAAARLRLAQSRVQQALGR